MPYRTGGELPRVGKKPDFLKKPMTRGFFQKIWVFPWVFSKRGFFQNMIIAQLSIGLLIQITNWKYVLTWFLNDVYRITIITVNIS